MRKNNRSMRLERLEGRSLMAGDVFAAVRLGNLKIEGDNQANEIAVVDLGGGKVEITGQNGTKVNGLSSVTISGNTTGFKAELKGGDDIISWRGIESHITPLFKIETGAGNDSVAVDKLFAGLAEIETGLGNDVVDVLNAKAAILEIETQAGDDSVRIGSSTNASNIALLLLKIETGSGNDQVQIENSNLNATSAKIELGTGNDKAVISKVSGTSSLSLSGGFGTDAVVVEDSVFRGMQLDLGAGDSDDLRITRVTSSRTKLSGGLGLADKLTLEGSELGSLSRSGFEIV